MEIKALDKVKIARNWTVPLPKTVREYLNASQGDFLMFVLKGNDIIIKLYPLKKEMEAMQK